MHALLNGLHRCYQRDNTISKLRVFRYYSSYVSKCNWTFCYQTVKNLNSARLIWANAYRCTIKAGLQIRLRNWKLIFLFLNQNICCGYSKELSRWDGSFEHPKHMFKVVDKKIIAILRSKILLSWLYDKSRPFYWCVNLHLHVPTLYQLLFEYWCRFYVFNACNASKCECSKLYSITKFKHISSIGLSFGQMTFRDVICLK